MGTIASLWRYDAVASHRAQIGKSATARDIVLHRAGCSGHREFFGARSSGVLANPTNVLRCTAFRLVEQTRIPGVFIVPTNCAGQPA
jgi:hypothetical protein